MYQEESFKTQRVVYAHTRSDEGDMEYKMHCHDVYEVYYMISGNAEYLLEGRTYTPRPGSLIIIPPGCFHGLRVLDTDEYNRIRLHFAAELLQEEEQALLLEPFGTGWCCYEEQFQLEWYFHPGGVWKLWKKFTGYCNPHTGSVSFDQDFCNI